MKNKKISRRATATCSTCNAIKRVLGSVLCAALIVCQTVPVLATDEYGDPIVTATPVPEEIYHTDYYTQPADTDSIEGWVQGPQIEGESAVLMDMITGSILYSKNADKAQYPASITKIITCLLTLENMDLNDEVTITHDPVTTGQNIALKKGETLKVKDLLYALMLHSSNDAAEVLAIAVGGDFDTFAEMMNERAKECGAKNTTFHNPNGLNPDGQEHNWTTAYDISMMAREAMKNPTFRKLVTTTHHKIPATNLSKERKLKTTNPCLGVYDGITGVKTGTSKTAGFCFCGSAKRGNTELIAVSLNSGEDQRFTDVTKLLDYGFANYRTYTAEKGGKALKEVKVRRGDLHSVEAGLTQDLDLTLAKKDKGEGITTEVKLSEQKLTAPVKKGVQVGTVTAYDKNHKKLAEAKLVTLESAKKGGILSYIGIADEDRGVFLVGLLIAVVLVILILLILRRMRRKKRARRKAQRNRAIRRRAREREKDPFNRNV